ncbi:MAG: hypothetical protein H6505_02550 [Calditrichaeota bacterium]|nr:hypothetical protein [Calditrichota bacterium]
MSRWICIALLSLWAGAALAQVVVEPTDLYSMIGEWEGTLTYVDPADDTTHVTVAATFSADTSAGKLVTRLIYPYAGERDSVEWSTMELVADGRRIIVNDKTWFISTRRVTQNGLTIVYQSSGQDNNRTAHITRGFFVGAQDTLLLTKQVLYQNAAKDIMRQRFGFKRVSE